MAISRRKKEELVDQYGRLISDSAALIFTDFTGVTVPEMQQLRRHMGQVDATFMVVKNRLLKIALVDSGCEEAAEQTFVGPMGVVFSGDDIGSTVKGLRTFVRQEYGARELLNIKGGVVANQLIDGPGMAAMADLPSLPELRSMLLSTLLAPATQLTQIVDGVPNAVYRVISAPSRGIAQVLTARAEQ